MLTTDPIELRQSRLPSVLGAIVMLAAALLLAWLLRRGWYFDVAPLSARAASRTAGITPDGFAAAVTALIAIVLAGGAAWLGWRAWRGSTGSIVTLSPAGLLDTRLSPQLISWRAIQAIDEWHWQGRRGIVLTVEPAILAVMALPSDLRDGRRIGRKALPFFTRDLDTRYGACLGLLRAYHATYRAKS